MDLKKYSIQSSDLWRMVKNINVLILLMGLALIGSVRAGDPESQDGSKISITVMNFIYIYGSGLDEQVNSTQEIERAVLFPAIINAFRKFGVSSYSMNFEKVGSGNLDYTASFQSAGTMGENPPGLTVWGMVSPVAWPDKYDLTLIFYLNSQPAYGADVTVRQGEITSWNAKKCSLPVGALGVFSGILALKVGAFENVKTEAPDRDQIEAWLNSTDFAIPYDFRDFLLNWDPAAAEKYPGFEGVLNLYAENGTTYKFIVDQSYHHQLESFLNSEQPKSWILDQSGLLMPEIKFGSKAAEDVTSRDVLRSHGIPGRALHSLNIGIIPFVNESGSDDGDWLGFGMEYLLTSKFSKIPAYRLVEREAAVKFTEVDSASVHVNGINWSLDYSIGGSYRINGNSIDLDISITHAFSGVPIATDHYNTDLTGFFDVIDDIAGKFTLLTNTSLTDADALEFNRRVTNSMRAFEYFCMGYLESSDGDSDRDRIIHNFKSAIAEDPAFWGAYYNLGTTYYNMDRYTDALTQFDIIIGKFPSFELAYLGRGMTYLKNNDFRNASEDFLRYKEYRPYDYRGWYYAGRCALRLNQPSQAIEYLSQAIELQPMNSRAYYELGNVYYATNRFGPAIQNYLKTLDLDPGLLAARQNLGESYYRIHNFINAFEQFKKILLVNPRDPEANFMIGITIYKRAALDEYIDEFLEIYGLLNQEELRSKKLKQDVKKQRIYDQMITSFYQAQAARGNFFEATFNLAMTYQELGKPDSALYYYEKTLRINPKLARARIVLAKFYERQHEFDQALEQYKQAVRIDPGYFIDYSKLGPEYDNADVLALVKKELEAEIRSDPGNIDSRLSLANILFAEGFKSQAAGLYRKVLDINPEEQTAVTMLARIDTALR
jgi:tetratricopeptide (TPR) repeat protein/TolB-like protein